MKSWCNMKDLIDEKNKQDKMKRSIIKFWNVNYGEPELIGSQEDAKTGVFDADMENGDMEQAAGPAEDVRTEGEDSIPMSRIEQILKEKDANLRKIIEQERVE